MHAAIGILQKSLSKTFTQMHNARVEVLLEAVSALIRGRRLVLMDIARQWPGAQCVSGPLKKIDRLLGNEHLHAERQDIYAAMAQWLLKNPRVVIVVDWSDLQAHGQKFLLRAGVPVNGQTMTVLERVYTEKEKQKPQIERQFLEQLRSILPEGVKPIIVTDAGFKRPWFRAVQEMGWDYLGRVRAGTRYVQLGVGNPTVRISDLHQQASTKAALRGCGARQETASTLRSGALPEGKVWSCSHYPSGEAQPKHSQQTSREGREGAVAAGHIAAA